MHYIAMEYVEGETLYDLLRKGAASGRRSPPTSPYQIADALARAHAAGIIHRDLKPSNIMVTPERRAKVLDFGLGKLARPGSSDSNALTAMGGGATTPGVLLGTAAYMSPEQGVGGMADARSDQFAFGLILYELLTGTHPFARGSSVQTLSAIIEDEAEPLAVEGAEDARSARAYRRALPRQGAGGPLRFDGRPGAGAAEHLRSPAQRPHARADHAVMPPRSQPAVGVDDGRSASRSRVAALAPVAVRRAADCRRSPASRQVALLPFTNVGGGSGQPGARRRPRGSV